MAGDALPSAAGLSYRLILMEDSYGRPFTNLRLRAQPASSYPAFLDR